MENRKKNESLLKHTMTLDLQDEEKLIFTFVCLNHEMLSKTFHAQFKKKYALTPAQMGALGYIKANKSLSMSDISNRMHISKQQTTQMVAALVKRGLVKRDYDSGNRRTIHVEPTDLLNDILNEGEAIFLHNALAQLNQLSGEDKSALLEAMQTVVRILPSCDFSLT